MWFLLADVDKSYSRARWELRREESEMQNLQESINAEIFTLRKLFGDADVKVKFFANIFKLLGSEAKQMQDILPQKVMFIQWKVLKKIACLERARARAQPT